jgi:uncharacterized protein involved in oxidation of intracellular sulfur
MTEDIRRKTLFILNDPPEAERLYNGMRLVNALSADPGDEVRVFLMGDAVLCGGRNHWPPEHSYTVERMLGVAVGHGVAIGSCATCLKARGITEQHLVHGVHKGTLNELAEWTRWADKVIVF